ncbi:hypothetical protein ACJ4V0_18960 [Phreatobacter sp. HK31-P]
MKYIALAAVIAVVLLQATGSIPRSSVGGSLVIGLAFIVAALAVGIHEAWTEKRGVVGWIVNLVVSFVGALAGANLGGMAVVVIFVFLNQIMLVNLRGSSLADQGSPLMEVALAGVMLAALLGSWGALKLVNRWR